MTTMSMFASDCHPFDVVPWEQMRDAVPLTLPERANFKEHTRLRIWSGDLLVRFDKKHIFMKHEDMAICLYEYERDFK